MTHTSSWLTVLLATSLLCFCAAGDPAVKDDRSARKLLLDFDGDFDSIFGRADANTWANALVRFGSGGTARADAAATALVRNANGRRTAFAKALAVASSKDWEGTGTAIARAAAKAQATNTDGFASAMAQAFADAMASGTIDSYAKAVAKSITEASDRTAATKLVASAMATAIAAGGSQAEGLARASASAICTGGSTATAFAEAWAETIKIAPNGCVVLTQAYSFALAQCNNGVATAIAGSRVLTTVLGGCGITTTRAKATAKATATADAFGNTDDFP